MTWDDYLEKIVTALAQCRDDDAFKEVLSNAQDTLDRSNATAKRRAWFWDNLQDEFEKAPKLILSDTTAAAKLYALMNIADQLIADAAKR